MESSCEYLVIFATIYLLATMKFNIDENDDTIYKFLESI